MAQVLIYIGRIAIILFALLGVVFVAGLGAGYWSLPVASDASPTLAPKQAVELRRVVPAAVQSGETGRVVSVVDGDTVVLDSGAEVRLTSIQAPKLPLGRKGFRKWPYADKAKTYLEKLALHQEVSIELSDQPQDRWGRVLAQLYAADDVWLQGAMVRAGLARVYTFADNNKHAEALYALERAARAEGQNIWTHPFYAIRTPDNVGGAENAFQLVQGTVVDVAKVRGRVYLNFGEDYKTDFTILVPSKVRRAFEKHGQDLGDLQGRVVRARGWVKNWNGPMIELTHRQQ